MSLPIDHAARQQAIDTNGSYCVTAPAGSGKTELLTQRFLKLLGQVDKPEQILALTFTRKAAAEMRERILSALRSAQLNKRPAAGHKRLTFDLARQALTNNNERNWALLECPARLNIRTLDSLCQSIVKDQPLMSGSGGRLQPVDDEDALYFRAIDNFLHECAQKDAFKAPVYASVSRLLLLVDNNIGKLRELLRDMLPFRDQWLGHAGAYKAADQRELMLNTILRKRIEQALLNIRDVFKPYEQQILPAAQFAAEHISQLVDDSEKVALYQSLDGLTELPSRELQSASAWRALLDLLFTAEYKPRKKPNKLQGFPPKPFFKNSPDKLNACLNCKEDLLVASSALADDPVGMRAVKTVASLPLDGYADEQLQLLESMVDCLFRLVAHLKLVFAQTGRCDHLEITASALLSLNAQDELPVESIDDGIAYRWCEKFHHILVDEFQDTSLSQYELLQSLTRDWAEFNALDPEYLKTLFLVGDGMQSIYSFRAAKVGLFLKARENGIGGIKLRALYLQQNFRSDASIVDWVNQCFYRAFPAINDVNSGAVRYEEATPVELPSDSNVTRGVEAHIFVQPSSQGDDLSAAEFQAQLGSAESWAIVKMIQGEQQQAVRHNSDVEIAVLVRARSHLRYLLPVLDEAGVSWEGIDIDALTDRESIMDCLTLTRALMNPTDELAWYSLLRSPLAGITLVDLQGLSDIVAERGMPSISLLMTDPTTWQQCRHELVSSSDNERVRLAQIVELLQAIYSRRNEFVLSDWLRYAWETLGGDAAAQTAFSGDESEAVEDYFLLVEDVTQQNEARGELTVYAALEAGVERLFASSGGGRASSIDTAAVHQSGSGRSAVKIMTMHKSKGLEFDVVILPQLHRKPAAESTPMLISHEYLFDDNTSGLLLYPQDKRQPLAADNLGKSASLYAHLREEKKYARELETTRLLYVASTRTKRRLWLSGCALCNEDYSEASADVSEGIRPPVSTSLLAKMWKPLCSSKTLILHSEDVDRSEVTLTANQSRAHMPGTLRRLRSEALCAIDQAREPGSLSSAQLSNMSVADEDTQQASVSTGVLVHEILELVHIEGLQAWKARSIDTLRTAWSSRLRQLECPLAQIDIALANVTRAVNTLLNSDYGDWLFDTNHRAVTAEWRLRKPSVNDQQSTALVVLDRSFIDRDNTRWIIDFKSSEPKAGEPVETFLQRELDTYRPQLELYRSAVERYDKLHNADVLKIRCALYFPLPDAHIVLE